MIDFYSYSQALQTRGNTLGNIRVNQSNDIINRTFLGDPEYRKVYVLTPHGWEWADAKYQKHTTPSILKDSVDYYLQFRPGVEYPTGCYVLIPDEKSPYLNLTREELKDPFSQPVSKRTQWWIIVGKTTNPSFIRHNVLKCNWEFRWIWKGKIHKCFACNRNANSYTSGVWESEYSTSLDQLTGAWLPDTHFVYGDDLEKFGLSDTRTIMHEQRFMITNNVLDPKCYITTKIIDMFPQGIIKISIKQDDFNIKRDNVDLLICDYYKDDGDPRVEWERPEMDYVPMHSHINSIFIDENGEAEMLDGALSELYIGKSAYFGVHFSDDNITPKWRIKLNNSDGEVPEEDIAYYEGLIQLIDYNDGTVLVRVKKANILLNKSFILEVSDGSGNYYSSVDLVVVEE